MAKYRFRLVAAGAHASVGDVGATQHSKKGAIIESDDELDVMFSNKFRRLSNKAKEEEEEEVTFPFEATDPDTGGEIEDLRGKDVTQKFKNAVSADVVVMQLPSGDYNVYDADVLVNPEPLSLKDVRRYLHTLVKE